MKNKEISVIRRSGGFTLIEILLALFIFVIVITTLFGSYRSISSIVEAVDGSTDDYRMASNCLNRMITDIRAVHIAVSPGYAQPEISSDPDPWRVEGKSGGDVSEGDFSSLRFTSSAHVSIGKDLRNGIGEIVYYVRHDEAAGQYVLRRADNLPPYEDFQPSPGDPVLCEKLKSLKFNYYDEDGEPHETWDSESRQIKYATPRAVQIRLEIGDESNSIFFETMIEFPVYRDKIG